jgi:Kef-type K+ transport system membrane component KefB
MASLTGLISVGEIEFVDRVVEFLSTHAIFNVGLLLIAGYTFGKIAEKLKLPSITGYIVAGLLMGESVLNLVSHEMTTSLESVTEVALSIIALTIGGEFRIEKLKRAGADILVLTLFEAVFAFIAVTAVLSIIGMDLKFSLILGAISAATAPAATVIIIKELRARGTFVDYLYGVVAFDDAVCVLLFSIVFAIVSPMFLAAGAAAGHSGFLYGLLHAAKDLVLSFLIGLVGGVILHLMIRKKYKLNEILIISISIIFLCTALALVFHLSPLISNMAFGAVLVNLSNKNKRVFSVLEPVTPPLFALFFILAGMELDVGIMAEGLVVVYGLVYLAARFGGKMLGVNAASRITKAPQKVKKYLGLCLFPQAGVAIGLVLFVKTSPALLHASADIRSELDFILNIVLVSVFLNELVGPSISRYGIVKGAELEK